MAELKMFAAGIDGGSHFDMRVRSLTGPTWKNNWQVENEGGKSVGSIWNIRTPSARYAGYEAPIVTFTGIIDTNETALGSMVGGSLFITVERLGSMSLHGSAYILYPMLQSFLGSPFSNAFTGSIPCTINTVTPQMDTTYQRAGSEYIVNYNMNITFVSGPI